MMRPGQYSMTPPVPEAAKNWVRSSTVMELSDVAENSPRVASEKHMDHHPIVHKISRI